MTSAVFSPEYRNMQIVSSILLNTYGAEGLTKFSTVCDAVDTDIRSSNLAGVAPVANEAIERVIMSITSVLIRSGLLICNTYDRERGRITYSAETAIGLAPVLDAVLQLPGSFPADPSAHNPYYGTDEADKLVQRLGNIDFCVMNSASDGAKADRLSFTFHGTVTVDNIAAAQKLDDLFNGSIEVRQAMVRAGVQDGSIYLAMEDADLGFRDHECALGG